MVAVEFQVDLTVERFGADHGKDDDQKRDYAVHDPVKVYIVGKKKA